MRINFQHWVYIDVLMLRIYHLFSVTVSWWNVVLIWTGARLRTQGKPLCHATRKPVIRSYVLCADTTLGVGVQISPPLGGSCFSITSLQCSRKRNFPPQNRQNNFSYQCGTNLFSTIVLWSVIGTKKFWILIILGKSWTCFGAESFFLFFFFEHCRSVFAW